MEPAGTDPYAISIDDLERSAHVPAEDQVTSQPEPPAEGVWPPEELDRQRLLGITSAGRLRLP